LDQYQAFLCGITGFHFRSDIIKLWRRLYIEMKYRFEKNKIENILLQDILQKVITVILPLILLAVLAALQQKYSIIKFGKSEGYTELVIGILTLYGILYVFLQFIINYTLQDRKNDLYWGRSITQELFVQTLGFKFFGSIFFKLLLVYGVIYPYTSEALVSAMEKLSITESFLQARDDCESFEPKLISALNQVMSSRSASIIFSFLIWLTAYIIVANMTRSTLNTLIPILAHGNSKMISSAPPMNIPL